ncbi:hypothetical protein J6590_066051 [Homalodisca vitripennis]|nr:hypothetical protein J6590_066051 [Homalodisca vitripennis]
METRRWPSIQTTRSLSSGDSPLTFDTDNKEYLVSSLISKLIRNISRIGTSIVPVQLRRLTANLRYRQQGVSRLESHKQAHKKYSTSIKPCAAAEVTETRHWPSIQTTRGLSQQGVSRLEPHKQAYKKYFTYRDKHRTLCSSGDSPLTFDTDNKESLVSSLISKLIRNIPRIGTSIGPCAAPEVMETRR